MWTSPMELKCLWMWLLFGVVKGNEGEKCPAPPRSEFADVTVKVYAPGTVLYYECDRGYDRWSGEHPGIKCTRGHHGASWSYSGFKCIDKNILMSMGPTELHFTQEPEGKTQSPAGQKQEDFPEFHQTAPTVDLEFTQKPEIKTGSSVPQKQEDLSEFAQKEFCGPPKTLPHASLKLKKHYYVGQELHFSCQSGYDKRPPSSGTITCKKVNGSIIWTSLNVQCTNGTNGTNGTNDTNDTNNTNDTNEGSSKTGSTHLSPCSSVTLTALCFVLLIVPAVFV